MGSCLKRVHTTPEASENGGFTFKTLQTFSVHTTPEEFENTTITGHFELVFEEYSVSVYKTFSVHTRTKSRRFQIPFKWRFGRAPILGWTVGLTVEINLLKIPA